MISSTIFSELKLLNQILEDNQLVLIANTPVKKIIPGSTTSPRIVRITWPSIEDAELFREPMDTVLNYLRWLDSAQYSFILFDGSMIQISYDFADGRELIKHRLVYYPAPYDLDTSLLVDGTYTLSELVRMCLAENTTVKLRSPLRFDYDLEAASNSHPGSHLTLLRTECRLPVVGPLSLGHFVRFVIRHFYPEFGNVHTELSNFKVHQLASCITPSHQLEIHLHYRSA